MNKWLPSPTVAHLTYANVQEVLDQADEGAVTNHQDCMAIEHFLLPLQIVPVPDDWQTTTAHVTLIHKKDC